MNRIYYKSFFDTSPIGTAYLKIIYNNHEIPCDYEFIEINHAFEMLTGLKDIQVLGKRVTELEHILKIVGLDWFGLFEGIANHGGVKESDEYIEVLNRWYKVNIVCSKRDYLVAYFSDITEQKNTEKQLKKREKMLKSIASAADILLKNKNYNEAISKSLAWIGEATEVDRTYYFENHYDSKSKQYTTSQKIEWCADGVKSELNNPELKDIPFSILEEIIKPLSKRKPFHAITKKLKNKSLKEMMSKQKILSILVLPVFIKDEFKGFVGLDECKYERIWTESSYSLLQSFAGSISKAIERKKYEEEIEYLCYHDHLTGLFNRRYLDDEMKKMDIEECLPISIIIGDVNGLKIINDSFGHLFGDHLLQKSANVIKDACDKDAKIGRWGGDEFMIILPKTSFNETEKVVKNIKSISKDTYMGFVALSISLGWDTKIDREQDIVNVIKNAEDYMYKNKLLESDSIRSSMIKTVLRTLYEKNPREEKHSKRVSEFSVRIGEAMHLSEMEVEKLKVVGLLHDVGKIAIKEGILNKTGKLTDEELHEIKHHTEIGYRILSLSNEMTDLIEYVVSHHERWDGKGYPNKKKEQEIPLLSRIIAVADAYDAMTSDREYRKAMPQEEAIEELINNMGTQFDPTVVRVFVMDVLKEEIN